ncbi:MAG: type II toxin-antitoxin system VapC family toxin [Anaerolineae bacterium]|nr:type II toxin-antitoxin system VapC family toxin [Anaerolineae bacterium]
MARRVVMDANLALALFLRMVYTAQVYRLMDDLQEQQAEIFAPLLWEYECVSALRRAMMYHAVPAEDAAQFVFDLLALEVVRAAPSFELHQSALRWAERLGQSKAYDAQYIALAEQLQADFWSADEKLVNALKAQGVGWAHWIGEVGC